MTAREMTLAQLNAYDVPPEWMAIDAGQMAAERPDAQFVADDDGELRARCSVWWRNAPPLPSERVGVIGHFGARDLPSAVAVLDAACAGLANCGCTIAIGPMDGTTWHRYRLVTEAGVEPPFLLEPANPESWPGFLEAAGFTTLATYRSLVSDDLTSPDPRAVTRAVALGEMGIVIRPLDLNQFGAELERIYSVAIAAFRDNLLYTPIPDDEFAEQYLKLRPIIDPRLVLLAIDGDRTAGFVAGIPGALNGGVSTHTMILKTLAILPDRERYSGLGRVLAAQLHAIAHSIGYTRVIHALIQDQNHSLVISERTASVMRRYALYARRIAP